MALSILSRRSPSKTTTSTSNIDDYGKSRRKHLSLSTRTSVDYIKKNGAILAVFRDLVGILLIAFALPFFYTVGVWLGESANLLSKEVTIIEHTTRHTNEFSLQNHRIKKETAPCGAHKCFYQSETDPGIGFLVVRKDPSRSEDLYEQWKQNFLLDPPYEQNISETLASVKGHKDGGDRYLSDHPVTIQKVKRAPDKSIMIRCSMNDQHKMQTDLRYLLASMSGVESLSFAQQIRKGLKSAIYVMEQEPWYAGDWQALVDSDGTLVDIDVAQIRPETPESIGREFGTRSRLDWIDQCCTSFEEILRQVMPADNATICSASPHSLRLEDLNKNPVMCDDAMSKLCLFGDSKNTHVGYLVANTTNKYQHSVLESNWEVARMLTTDFKINHNILGSPRQVNSTLMVQKVRRFHNMTVLFTCDNKLPKSGEEVDSFIGYIRNSKLFKNNVKHQAKRITNMLIETNQSLDSSLQVRVDSQGYVYLLNLHNVLKKEIPTLTSLECLKALDEWADSVV